MGDETAGQVELTCPGCETTFHLRPRKARMPRNPIPCPKCGTPIQMTTEQVKTLRKLVGQEAPAAQVIRRRKNSSVSDETLDEMERLANDLKEPSNPRPSGTLMGHPIAVAQNFDRDSADHKTREADDDQRAGELDERPKTSEVPLSEVERARAEMVKDESKMNFSSFGSEADHEVDTAESDRDDVHNATTLRPPGMPPAHAPLSEVEEATAADPKVPLSELLKKVRHKNKTDGLPRPKLKAPSGLPSPRQEAQGSLEEFTDGIVDDIVDDVVGATERLTPVQGANSQPGDIGEASSTERTENSMLARLKKIPRSGLREKPGMAGERRGSGFIRLPESDILDLCGEGGFRLRVEEIVYEPIDEAAIKQLIAADKLKGKDEIAESDGDWHRLANHPIFAEHAAVQEAQKVAERVTAAEPGKQTKPMFGAVSPPKPTESSPPPSPADQTMEDDAGPTQPMQQVGEGSPQKPSSDGASTSSGEWLRTELDSTFDNLPVADAGHHTPPPNQAAALEAAYQDEEDAAPEDASAEIEMPIPEADEDYKLDGPPSYPAIKLPDAETAEPEVPVQHQKQPPKKRSLLPLVGGFLVLGGVIAAGGYLFTSGALDHVGQTDSALPPQTTPATTAEPETTPEEIPEPPPEPTRAEKIATAKADGDWAAALPLIEEAWSESPTAALALDRIDARLGTADYRGAREAIREARSVESVDAEALDSRFSDSLAMQAESERKSVSMTADWSELERVSTRPLLYRVVDPDGQAWRFIPDQDGKVTWRAEIAFYELCGILDCGFAVPSTHPATIETDVLEQLAGDEVVISAIRSSDGTARGALRRAIEEEHTGWPIEETGIWKGWLNGDTSDLDEPLAAALDSLDEDSQKAIVDARGEATTRDLAMQTANILAADYLVNNFDRFASRSENYGTTVRLADGQLVSVSNSAAFQPRTSTRVRGRFSWTSRFGRDFVESVRRLDRETVEPILFPDASDAERARLSVFWDQRDRFIERVDSLVNSRGEESVMPF